jgi:hypothetical protein
MSQRSQNKAARRFPIGGASRTLAGLLAEFRKAEGIWSRVENKDEHSHAAKVAWADVEKAELAIARYRAKTGADIAIKLRLDSELGGVSLAEASSLYKSALRDAERLGGKGGAA